MASSVVAAEPWMVRGVPGDRCCQELAQQRLCRAGFADQHQSPVRGQRHHAAFHQGPASHIFARDLLPVAQYELHHRLRRELPAGSDGAFLFPVALLQELQLVGVTELGRWALHVGHVFDISFKAARISETILGGT